MESLSESQRSQNEFNSSIISLVETNHDLLDIIFDPKPSDEDLFSVILFAPLLKNVNLKIYCKYHPLCVLTDGGKWVSEKRQRTLYDYTRRVKLISRELECELCENPYLSHDVNIIKSLPPPHTPPFLLSHKEGITLRAAQLIWNSVANGELK